MPSFREIQLQVESIYSADQAREQLNNLVDFCIESSSDYEQDLRIISNMRKLPIETLKEHKVFFIDEGMFTSDNFKDEFKDEALGFWRRSYCVFDGRVVYPVFDVRKNVMGFVGWDKFELPKYLDSKNQGYKAKNTTLYGMEKIHEYYSSREPVFFTEGIVCALYLRSKGFNAMATLGSHLTPYVLTIIKRFGHRAVIIPDNDTAGESFVRQAKTHLREATVIQPTIAKDVDDSRLKDNGKYEAALIKELKEIENPYLRREVFRVR